MRLALFNSALLAAALAGCGTRPAPAPTRAASAAPGPAASAPSPARPTLASEQRRLAELFRGTPVVFAMQPDGRLRVAVPLRYCFDRGGVAVKPPLAAVLDRVATSQRDATTRLRVAAAADPGAADQGLARDRAQSTSDYLVARGIRVARLTVAGVAQVDGVEILVAEAPPR